MGKEQKGPSSLWIPTPRRMLIVGTVAALPLIGSHGYILEADAQEVSTLPLVGGTLFLAATLLFLLVQRRGAVTEVDWVWAMILIGSLNLLAFSTMLVSFPGAIWVLALLIYVLPATLLAVVLLDPDCNEREDPEAA